MKENGDDGVVLWKEVIAESTKNLEKYWQLYGDVFPKRLEEDTKLLNAHAGYSEIKKPIFSIPLSEDYSFRIELDPFTLTVDMVLLSGGSLCNLRTATTELKNEFIRKMKQLYSLLSVGRETGKMYENPKLERWM